MADQSPQPLLASDILKQAEAHPCKTLDQDAKGAPAIKLEATTLNDMLDGGFHFGTVHCITSEQGIETAHLTNALIASHLKSSIVNTAVVIDSTLAFDVDRLYKTMLATSTSGDADQEESIAALDRLNIMKVFDFVGLTEAVDEVQAGCEAIHGERDRVRSATAPIRATIADSQDEDEDLSGTEPIFQPTAIAQKGAVHGCEPLSLLVIQDLSQIFAPLMKNNFAHGQAVLSSFLRSLGIFTRSRSICTVVFARAASIPAAKDTCISQFNSCAIRPMLGNTLSRLVDLHMYQHRFQNGVVGIGTAVTQTAYSEKTDEADILEVVQDRYSGRVGLWAGMVVDDNGCLRGIP